MQRQSQLYRQPPTTEVSHPPAPATLPLVDDRFELQKKLGEGGMGEVYLARDLASGRDVALKRMAGWMLTSGWKAEDAAALFSNEAEALLRISHPCVVGIISVPDPPSYIVMEYVRGLSLDRIGMLPEDVLRLSLDLCDALSAIHTVGVIHRDIKPENILVSFRDERMNIKLIDFGTARMRGKRAKDPFFCTPVGTAQFMSPEALEAGGRADERSDIFSLGALMYDKLAGIPPFAAGVERDHQRALEVRKAETYVPLKEMAPNLPEEVCGVVDRAMAQRQQDRFRSASEFRQAIENTMSFIGIS